MTTAHPLLTLSVLLLAASAVAAPVPKGIKLSDWERMEGRWVVATIDCGNGPEVPTGNDATAFWEVRSGKLSAGTEAHPGWQDREILLDPSKTPKWLDVPSRSSSTLFIYEMDGDTLKMVHSQPALNRPTDFTGDRGLSVYVYKRVKSKE